MHQLLRLIYSDQETSSAEIFRTERFDSAITRSAVGDYLLGIDASELYGLRLQEGALEKQLGEVKSSIRTIYSTFGLSGTDISLDFLNDRLNNLSGELSGLRVKLELVLAEPREVVAADNSASQEDAHLRANLDNTHQKLSELKQRRIEIESEIADSDLFLKELEERLASINESSIAESYLGTANFAFCPSCFSILSSSGVPAGHCALCKSPVSLGSTRSQLARMRNELALQRRESQIIRQRQSAELEGILRDVPAIEAQLGMLEVEFRRNKAQWRPPHQILVERLSREIGAKEQEIKNTQELRKLADLLDSNNQKVGNLEAELAKVRGRMEAVQREQLQRRQKAYLAVADNLRTLLKEDLVRQAEFENANEIDLDFGANSVTIDGQREFSASSMVYLRHSFHLALLLASTENPFFRFPRFVIVDGVEDGGMEPDRSFNFQKVIYRKSKAIGVLHQIILATSQICPELNIPGIVVGASFTHDKKSIAD